MTNEPGTRGELLLEVERLTARLEESEETLRAIRNGQVDALIVRVEQRAQVFTLKGADYAYRLLIETMNEGALTLLADGMILYSNRRFSEIVKTPLQQVIGASIHHFVTPADRQTLTALLEQAAQSNSKGEIALRAEDGALVPVLVSINRVPMEGAERSYAVVVTDLTDSTAQRRLEEALRQRAKELAEADRRKDEFLAMLAHELRNPLAPILNAVHVLRLRGPEDPALQRTSNVVERQVQHMARLLEDLLEVSRITRGKLELRKERVDLQTVVASAAQACRPLVQVREHELSISVPVEPVWVEADPTRLEQVFVNLLNNGAKYTDPGGRIWLTAECEGDEVVLRVRDTGRGIPPEVLPHIFDLFVQSERSLDRSEGGLGIGLTIVKNLVEMHGGTVRAHSDGPGQGSEFVVRLPARPTDLPGRSMTTSPAGESVGRAVSVLVVEDSVDAAETLAELLELMGHEVRVAHDGPTALEVALGYQPEVVLLDIGLPGMDGYEVARRLRQENRLAPVRLVALTGYGQEEDRRRSQEAGFDHHLVKPVDLATVEALLADSRTVGDLKSKEMGENLSTHTPCRTGRSRAI